jgi:hypothetical protein
MMMDRAAFAMALVSMFVVSPARAADVRIEFRQSGRCTVTIHDEASKSDQMVDMPGPATASSEYKVRAMIRAAMRELS